MTLRITPDDDSQRRPIPDTSDQSPAYSQFTDSQPGDEYIPEREFVLMPLFRRIGQMLGLRRDEEAEYIYAPENTVSQQLEPVGAPVPASEIAQEAPVTSKTVTDDILGIEPEIAEETRIAVQPSFAQSEPAVVSQTRFESAVEQVAEQSIQEPVLVQSASLSHHESRPEVIQKLEPVSAVPMTAPSETLPAAPVAPMTRQEAQDLAAQIREATAKISTVVAQAAAWLHSKEEEILRRAEIPLEPEKPLESRSQIAQPDQTPVVPLPARDQASKWEKDEVPALQREVAWQSEKARSTAVTAQPSARESLKRRLRVVSKPVVLPFWRRIDWPQQFTPKRVAILGASLMAILLVLGISFARRPAADELPQQTRTIDHGGVTLTTHPPTAAVTPQPQSARPESTKPAPHSQARRASNYDNGSDVVTHYYGSKPKPSPIPQTASAGVRHYSDTQ